MFDLSGRLSGWLDNIYFNFKNKIPSGTPMLFEDGWGSDDCIEAVCHRFHFPGTSYPIEIKWHGEDKAFERYRVRNGSFSAPYFKAYLPIESSTVNFRMILPQRDQICPRLA
jgi:hypothetical protein